MKKNNNSDDYKDWTTKKLKDEAICLDQCIEMGGYGSHDIFMLECILYELEKRGIEANHILQFNN